MDPSQFLRCLQNVVICLELVILICFNSKMQVRLSPVFWKNCIWSHLMPRIRWEPHWKIRCHLKIAMYICQMKSQHQYPLASNKVYTNSTKHLFRIWGVNRIRLVFLQLLCELPTCIYGPSNHLFIYLILELKRFVNHNADFY